MPDRLSSKNLILINQVNPLPGFLFCPQTVQPAFWPPVPKERSRRIVRQFQIFKTITVRKLGQCSLSPIIQLKQNLRFLLFYFRDFQPDRRISYINPRYIAPILRLIAIWLRSIRVLYCFSVATYPGYHFSIHGSCHPLTALSVPIIRHFIRIHFHRYRFRSHISFRCR